jgi:hypothetical protein
MLVVLGLRRLRNPKWLSNKFAIKNINKEKGHEDASSSFTSLIN